MDRWGGYHGQMPEDPDALNEYRGSPHREQLAAVLAPLLGR
jgi:hypothetical protein